MCWQNITGLGYIGILVTHSAVQSLRVNGENQVDIHYSNQVVHQAGDHLPRSSHRRLPVSPSHPMFVFILFNVYELM